MLKQTVVQQPITATHDESILVVERSILFEHDSWHGIRTDSFETYLARIQQHKQFMPRSAMELDPRYKQIIPYLIFQHENQFFIMQRHKKASEQRLQSKFSLGIGGHVRQEDMQGTTLFDWAQREFHEEVAYAGTLTIKPLGILNDDTNEVGQVHLGLVLLLMGNSSSIAIKSELANGWLASYEECLTYADRMENWSQLLMPLIKSGNF